MGSPEGKEEENKNPVGGAAVECCCERLLFLFSKGKAAVFEEKSYCAGG